MDFKLLGSILLIVGTSIGAGMLALPVATAALGFKGSLLLLFACWFIMTAGALLILEVNLWLPQNSNLISMAKLTLGPSGQILSWITYLLLLYSLLAAYIAGGSDLFYHLLNASGIAITKTTALFSFTLIFGFIVYLGIRSVDYVNRGLMFVKLGAYLLLILLLVPFISLEHLNAGSFANITQTTAIMVTITSFGFAAIVPSLRVYFEGNVQKLRAAIILGSLVPLICYIAWDAAIMGIIPLNGEHGLLAIFKSQTSTSDLVNTLDGIVAHPVVTFFTKVFTSICVVTSFLGVALCLADFLADGFSVEKKGRANVFIHLCVFLPPAVIVLYYPNVFIKALEYAGIYCIVLLMLLPALMAWRGRYVYNLSKGYTLSGGKPLLLILIIIGVGLVLKALLT